QRRRRQWKRDLRENPEEAPYSEEDFGRYSTAELNGMDRDNTRRRGEGKGSAFRLIVLIDLEGRDAGHPQLTPVRETLLREPLFKLAERGPEGDDLVAAVSDLLPLAILREQPRQIALVRCDALLSELRISTSEDPLNRSLAFLEESSQLG